MVFADTPPEHVLRLHSQVLPVRRRPCLSRHVSRQGSGSPTATRQTCRQLVLVLDRINLRRGYRLTLQIRTPSPTRTDCSSRGSGPRPAAPITPWRTRRICARPSCKLHLLHGLRMIATGLAGGRPVPTRSAARALQAAASPRPAPGPLRRASTPLGLFLWDVGIGWLLEGRGGLGDRRAWLVLSGLSLRALLPLSVVMVRPALTRGDLLDLAHARSIPPLWKALEPNNRHARKLSHDSAPCLWICRMAARVSAHIHGCSRLSECLRGACIPRATMRSFVQRVRTPPVLLHLVQASKQAITDPASNRPQASQTGRPDARGAAPTLSDYQHHLYRQLASSPGPAVPGICANILYACLEWAV